MSARLQEKYKIIVINIMTYNFLVYIFKSCMQELKNKPSESNIQQQYFTWGLEAVFFTMVLLTFVLAGPPPGALFCPNFTISAQEFMAEKSSKD